MFIRCTPVSVVSHTNNTDNLNMFINSQYDRDLIITAHLTLPHPDLSP